MLIMDTGKCFWPLKVSIRITCNLCLIIGTFAQKLAQLDQILLILTICHLLFLNDLREFMLKTFNSGVFQSI